MAISLEADPQRHELAINQENVLDRLFNNQSSLPKRVADIQNELSRMRLTEDPITGAQYIPQFTGPAFAISYAHKEDGGRGQLDPFSINVIEKPGPDQIIMIPFSISLCGTDAGLISHLKKGDLDPLMFNLIAGHEAAGFIVGVGKNVDKSLIGQVMCLDSHYACGEIKNGKKHTSFDDCINDGCDGIVSIRGSKGSDGQQNPPIDGYWGRIITAPASAMTLPLPSAMVEYLAAPSALESLGNIYEIIEQLKVLKLTEDPHKTILAISGMGATGYPLSVVAKHYGFEVVGIEPSEGNLELARQNNTCIPFAKSSEAADHIFKRVQTGDIDNVISAVMSGSEQAYQDALDLQQSIREPNTRKEQSIRKTLIAFGLFADRKTLMPGLPYEIPQRDFVFGRKYHKRDDGIEIKGVCGRSMEAWRSLVADLSPDDLGVNPKNPQLVADLNAAIVLAPNISQFNDFALTMMDSEGIDDVFTELQKERGVKFATNLLKTGGKGFVGSYH